jgi:TDG/mug DNA glycosylase family protein
VARVYSFAPISDAKARVLILGSMPGVRSLEAAQYYAHRQNQFWKIVGEVIGVDASEPYARRLAALKASGIALWDVLRSCRRESSLDSAIERDSIQPNDFAAFLRRRPHIAHVLFNGATAEALFHRHVRETLPPRLIYYHRLPSTSPAHAGMPYGEKLKRWRAALKRGLAHGGR